ncbi:hypothetical protein P153DRAFT_396836 [Dothidotthia symphoricarpi CBS 119687]|uniref:Uncharacterized protein n=1 Tax=Dothidotthia symphoricarpi CBS 119687 TaxID=1392245 RepID=A0A6A6ACM9_9PLEO|nr:uncharacterized protein P153DRAFT_396836 [Dothidotthia symphoricarpi CBS 119687]KAF2129579.1 hypothetical protein P153DRAFT_396836 [Dothidotthia symphoricarpi CBS 119687]
MAFLQNAKERLWNYISPRKTQQRRDKPFKVPAIPLRKRLTKEHVATPEARDMSPGSRVKTWHTQTSSPYGDVDVTLLPPSPPSSLKRSYDFDGDTLIPSSPCGYMVKTRYPEEEPGSSEDESDATGNVTVVDQRYMLGETKTVYVEDERQTLDREASELRAAGWPEDAVFLFQKLAQRGREPLLPIDWIDDFGFSGLPGDLFTVNAEKAFIKPALGSTYHAQLALSPLFDLGGLVRNVAKVKAGRRTPEYLLKQSVDKYTDWALKDGDIKPLWDAYPLFQTVSWDKRADIYTSEQKLIWKLGRLHELWAEALEKKAALGYIVPEVPTLYGVVASHTVMAFVRYDPPTYESKVPQIRLVATFDFGGPDEEEEQKKKRKQKKQKRSENKQKDNAGFDVWNGFAIAMLVVHCRNIMMQLKEYLPEVDVCSEDDPDL